MRPIPCLLVLMLWSAPVAAGVRLVGPDERGVTLELDVPEPRRRPSADGFTDLDVPGFLVADVPGRPRLPYASTLVALPPGMGVRVVALEASAPEALTDVRVALGDLPVFREGPQGEGLIPGREPAAAVADGPWPATTVEIGEPFVLRRQRLVAIRLQPFRHDPVSGTVTLSRSLRVRLEFTGARGPAAPATEDRHWEPVLREGLINYEQSRSWRMPAVPAVRPTRSAPAGPAGAQAFDEDYPEVRVRADSTGFYRLRFTDLSPSGYPANIPVAQVSVHRHEFVEGAVPPYVTIELPIEVHDVNGNGVFDGIDRIFVFVQSWAERSRASVAQRAWGDAEVIYATAVSGTGLRAGSRPGWRGAAAPAQPATYPTTQHWERNFSYYLFPPDTLTDQFHWSEVTLYYDRPDTFRFETNHLDTTRAVTFTATWMGRRDGSHVTWAQYRAGAGPFLTVADSVQWFGRGALTLSVTLPGSTVGEGSVNTFRAWGKGSTAAPDPATNFSDNVALNFIKLAYWRGYRALGNYLACNSGVATGEIQIRATGFTGASLTAVRQAMRVYDVTDSLAPMRLDLDTLRIVQNGSFYEVDFQDSVAAGAPHRYIAFTTGRVVPATSIAAVTRRALTARSTGDYLLVVPEAFLPAIDPLVQLRTAQGLNVVVAPFESVCDEFNGGRKSSYAIKRLVRHGFEQWNARFLLLFGDGSEDPLNQNRVSSTDWIPIQKINGPVAIQFGYEIIPSDPWYVCLSDCNVGGFTPVLQDLFVGRLPAQTLQQATDVVAKLVAYETFAADQTWRRRVLLSADDEYSGITFFGGGGGGGVEYCRRAGERIFDDINETIADLIQNQAGYGQAVIDTFSLQRELAGVACIPRSGDPCPCRDLVATQQVTHASVTPRLITRLNAGRLWWNYQGHANEFVLGHEDLYLNRGFTDDKDQLTNLGAPFLFSAFSCHANAFGRFSDLTDGRGPSLGEEMVLLPGRGAIASWASSGYEILPFSSTSHINVEWARAMFQTPPYDPFLGQQGARVVLGETIALALMRYVPSVTFNPNERGIAMSYHLLGDPATRLSIGEPQAVVLANQQPVADGQPVRLLSLGDTLRVEADLVSNVQITALSLDRIDGAGTQTIPAGDYTVTPAFPDTTAASGGGRRYHLSYGAQLRPESYVYTLRTRDRYGVDGAFDVAFQFLTQLRVDDNPIADNDPVSPAAALTLKVVSPRPLTPADLAMEINGANQTFTAAPAPGDATGREWILSWSHSPYPIGDYEVRLTVNGGGLHTRRFRVLIGIDELRLRDVVAFPNPFDETGTSFSFFLAAGEPADLQVRVFTTAGRLAYERIERGLAPGYHQLPWNGEDAEGSGLANGVYLYRLIATNSRGSTEHLGRLVKLRRPRRASTP